MSTRTRSRGRALAATLLGVVAASTLLGGSVHAQTEGDAPSLGGYEGTAQASGLHAFYNPEGLLPTAAPVDAGVPDALATITSGPTTFARSAVADPGDLLANPDALLTQADPSYPEGTVPEWPFRVTATSAVGEPEAESRPAPGLHSRVRATDSGSSAESSTAAVDLPAIATVGSMVSASDTTFDGSSVGVHARTEVSSFNLLDVLTIDSIVTDVVASSVGDGTDLAGGTTLSGAELMGQPVTIDAEGIHLAPSEDGGEGQSIPVLGEVTGSVPADLTKLLADAGIRVSLPGPIEEQGESTGRLASTGLRIDLELSERTVPILGQIADALPPLENPAPGAPSVEDLIVAARAKHLTAVEVGRAVVSLAARPAFVPPPFDMPEIDRGGAAPSTAAPSFSPTPSARPVAGAPVPAPAPGPVASVGGPPLSSETPVASLGAGIGALALLALLVQPVFGDRIARASAAILATSPTDTCPMEKP